LNREFEMRLIKAAEEEGAELLKCPGCGVIFARQKKRHILNQVKEDFLEIFKTGDMWEALRSSVEKRIMKGTKETAPAHLKLEACAHCIVRGVYIFALRSWHRSFSDEEFLHAVCSFAANEAHRVYYRMNYILAEALFTSIPGMPFESLRIIWKMKKLGMKKSELDKAEKMFIKDLNENGLSIETIAWITGRSPSIITRICKETLPDKEEKTNER